MCDAPDWISHVNILLIEDDVQALRVTAKVLRSAQYEVIEASDAEQALEIVRKQSCDIILSDVRMPRMSGYEFLKALKLIFHTRKHPPVLFMTAFGQLQDAVWAMKSGAVDFIIKPFNRARLLEAMETAKKLVSERPAMVLDSGAGVSLGELRSPAMVAVQALCHQISRSQSSVLITGESGTGKERVARLIHQLSPRHAKPFIAINCAAIPEALMESELFGHVKGAFTGADETKMGLFEAASGGTLLLDEIGELPLSVQAKLLRVLQDGEVRRIGATDSRKVDVRILAATHVNLKSRMATDRFRADLLYRLDVISIQVPALRERLEDLDALVSSLLAEHSMRYSGEGASFEIDREALELLKRHSWPGNVRELSNVLERAVVLCSDRRILAKDLPPHFQLDLAARVVDAPSSLTIPFGTPLKEVETLMIRRALEATSGDKALAAKILGVHERTIYRRLELAKEIPSAAGEPAPSVE